MSTHDHYRDELIASILSEARVFALIGASMNASRPSCFVMRYLLGKGYRVLPVNPHTGKQILGQTVSASMSELPAPVDVIDVFRNAAAALEGRARGDPAQGRARHQGMQLGVRNDQAAAEAEAAGLTVVMNRCPKIEYGRLSGEIGWAGVNAGRLTNRRPKLAARGVQNQVIAGKA
jgi:predicted CoA-binding protein